VHSSRPSTKLERPSESMLLHLRNLQIAALSRLPLGPVCQLMFIKAKRVNGLRLFYVTFEMGLLLVLIRLPLCM
jgi:hypothetical protein